MRPGITDPASLAFPDESELLARAADPEREYIEVILPRKLRAAADYAEQRHAGDRPAACSARTLRLLWARLMRGA